MAGTVEQGDGKHEELSAARPSAAGGYERDTQPVIRGKWILLVDDEPEVAAVLMEVLHLDGYEVESVENGEEALEKLRQRAYDVIVSDIRMPKVDGSALYRAIEQWQPQLVRRFLFLTGDTLSSGTREFLERTGAPSISKPFGLEEMRLALHRVLEVNDQP